jgi:16S rRNA (cytosine967-C5)-methyltransferase
MGVSPSRAVAFDILLRVEQQQAYSSELLHSQRLDALSTGDAALATELVMGVLRWRSSLEEAIAAASSRPLSKLDTEVLVALRLAAYQLLFLSRIPAHAAIDQSVELVKRAKKRSAAPFANAVLRKIAAAPKKPAPEPISGDLLTSLSHEYAHPRWLVERWLSAYGADSASALCRQDQQVPAAAIRVDNPALEDELKAEGIELAPGALLSSARVVLDGSVTRTRAFLEGRVFIQDEASQLVAALIGSGSRFLDCCAAPGGKTAAMAWRNPTAQVIAAELHPHRAALLRKRVVSERVVVIRADALKLPLRGGFDRVLADVPCSGTGTLARNPEIKWWLKPEELGGLHAKQVAILSAALQQLAPAGRLVYSTCSLEREENEDVVEEVLRNATGYQLRNCREELESLCAAGELVWGDVNSLVSGSFLRTIPGIHAGDGFFAAIIERKAEQQ